MATNARRTALTTDQQRAVRGKMMQTASKIAQQIGQYIDTGKIVIAGNDILLTSERLAAYRLILDRTVPTLSATEVTHRSGLESMDSGALVSRLADLVRLQPELGAKLQEALGGRVIEAQAVPDSAGDSLAGELVQIAETTESPESPE